MRQAFFQCLANSSWANHRYVVAPNISDEVHKEFRNLAKTYEVGLIEIVLKQLPDNSLHYDDSTAILLESTRKPNNLEELNYLYQTRDWKPFKEWIDAIPGI